MSEYLSNRVQKVKPSATLAVTAKANELKSQGIEIVPMGSGEPDFDTPENIASGTYILRIQHNHLSLTKAVNIINN